MIFLITGVLALSLGVVAHSMGLRWRSWTLAQVLLGVAVGGFNALWPLPIVGVLWMSGLVAFVVALDSFVTGPPRPSCG